MNEIIKAITIVISKNENGFDIETEVKKELFCEVKSSSYVDRYASNSSNITPTIVFEMRREDFDLCRITKNKKHYYPSKVEYDGAVYDLVRWRYDGLDKAQMICG